MALNTDCYAECRKQAHYAECHYAECRYAGCRGAEKRADLKNWLCQSKICF